MRAMHAKEDPAPDGAGTGQCITYSDRPQYAPLSHQLHARHAAAQRVPPLPGGGADPWLCADHDDIPLTPNELGAARLAVTMFRDLGVVPIVTASVARALWRDSDSRALAEWLYTNGGVRE
ncbi:hypothetical protein ACFVH4_06990 [Nocardia ignorata]|uniref:hypothetical protein n=1 Tax=Nocardia ignorata TaxID=145285 RepID=UPI00364555F4